MASSQAQLQRVGDVVKYKLPLLQEDRAIADPTSHWSYFFELKPGVRLLPDNYIDLHYTYSSTLLKGRGSLTVTFNGQPIETKELPFMDELVTKWQVQLPLHLFKQGFNEIRVNNRQRSIDGPCQDIDNMGNWIRFLTSSSLYLSRREEGLYPLVSYPFPYLDNLATSPVQSLWVMPPRPTPAAVSEAMDMASNWGLRLPSAEMRFRFTKTSPPPGSQAIFIGETSNYSNLQAAREAIGNGYAQAFSRADRSQLAMVGRNADGLDAIQTAFARQDLVNQMQEHSVFVNNKPLRPEPPAPRARMGEFTFEDVGVTQGVVLEGAFHREAGFTIMRPLRIDLGRESKIKIKFRHSASLNPLRSLLTIYVNDMPIGSAQLMPSNANGGELEALIPVDVLAQNRWNFKFATYHDLGSLDCSKSYDEVAWSVIEVDSSITLKPGLLLGRPYLESFPYMIPKDGQSPKQVGMFLPEDPSPDYLALAATVAAKAAQSNNVPLYWSTGLGPMTKLEDVDSAIIIGSYTDERRVAPFKPEDLLVRPSRDGKLKWSRRVQVIPGSLKGAVIVQAVKTPWSDKGVTYVILADNDAALRRFNDFLATRKSTTDYIAGEACLYTKEGKLVNIAVESGDDIENELARENERYTPAMEAARMFGVLAFIVLVIWVARQFVKRRPRNADV